MTEDKIIKINEVIDNYFENHPSENSIAAKKIMPELINAGVFTKDEKSGLPLRKVLRALDAKNELHKIPLVHTERNETATYWYFVRKGAEFVPTEIVNPISKKQREKNSRESTDEFYIVNLCNELLNEIASRQHTFDFLVGDLHRNGKTKTELPIDAYYKDLNLAIEFLEKENSNSTENLDKPNKITISGVNRARQRKIYSQRKRIVLRQENIQLIEINYSVFECDEQNKLTRNKEEDVKILKRILKNFLLEKE